MHRITESGLSLAGPANRRTDSRPVVFAWWRHPVNAGILTSHEIGKAPLEFSGSRKILGMAKPIWC